MSEPEDSNSGPEKAPPSVQPTTTEEYSPLMTGPSLAFVVAGLALAGFLIALDTSIVATAIPYITEEFHSTQDIGWYGAAYFLTLCSLQPIGGKIFALFSLKWSFLSFFALFEIGSLLCAVAVDSKMFICGRAVAGAGGAGIILGAFSIISIITPMHQRPLYVGIISSVFSIALVIGPMMGGAFTQHVTWRWCFYVNLPIGAATFLALGFLFNPSPRPQEQGSILERITRLDLVGAALFTPAVLMTLLALEWGGSTYAWRSATIIGLFLGSGGLVAVFAAWQAYKGEEAMIPPSVLRSRTVVFSSATMMFALGGIYAVVYYLPEWFQVVKGASPVRSGVMNIPAFLSQVVATVLCGGLVTKLGALNPWIWFGTVLMSVGTGLFSTFEVGTGSSRWIGFQVLQGFGFGCVAQMPVVAVQTALPPEQIPVGLAMAAFAQFFGSAIFVAVAQTIFGNVLITQLATLAPQIDAETLLLAGSAAVRSVVPAQSLPAVLLAFNKAVISTFYLSAGASVAALLVSLGIPWINVRGKNSMAGPTEA